VPLSIDEARLLVAHYNQARLHSAIGYVTPADKLAGQETAIFAARDQKLATARQRRAARRRVSTSLAACAAKPSCRAGQALGNTEHSEGASQGVQRGGNEPLLVCVNANKTGGESAPQALKVRTQN
jgi:hypothetical protein